MANFIVGAQENAGTEPIATNSTSNECKKGRRCVCQKRCAPEIARVIPVDVDMDEVMVLKSANPLFQFRKVLKKREMC